MNYVYKAFREALIKEASQGGSKSKHEEISGKRLVANTGLGAVAGAGLGALLNHTVGTGPISSDAWHIGSTVGGAMAARDLSLKKHRVHQYKPRTK